MGINTEMVYVLAAMESAGELSGKSKIIELGAQDVSAHPNSLRAAERCCFGNERGTHLRMLRRFIGAMVSQNIYAWTRADRRPKVG